MQYSYDLNMNLYAEDVDGNIVKAAAAAPTKDEFDKLVTAFNTLAKQFDDTITGLAASGVIKLPDKK